MWGGAMTIHYASAAATVPTQAEVNALVKQYLADEAPPVDSTVYLFAVFYDKDRVVDGQRYNKKVWQTKEACQEFVKTGGGDVAEDRAVLNTSLLQLRPLVQHFAEEHPEGKVVFLCATEADKPVKGETEVSS